MSATPTELLQDYGPWPIIGFLLWWIRSMVKEQRQDAKEAIQHITESSKAQEATAVVLSSLADKIERNN